MAIFKAYGEPMAFLSKYNPDYQMQICNNTDECLFGNYPTLGKLTWYGKNMPKAWMLAQLTDLSEYCGCKDKLEGRALEHCAEIITQRYDYLKISEIMLFIFRFKAGDYGKFYGSVDPLTITTSLNRFIIDRNILIDKHEQKQRELRDAEDKKNCISYAEYLRIKAEKEASGTTASNTTKQG
jgi:hypothetical protein